MTVVFPTKGDKAALVAFMISMELSEQDRLESDSAFGFSRESISNIESSCDSILEHLQTIAIFFTGGGPLTGRNVLSKTVFTSGSVLPRARKGETDTMPTTVLSDVSAADVFGIANPSDFFGAHREELEMVKVQLKSAKDVLQSANRAHAFVWTTDVQAVKKFLGAHMEQSLSMIYSMDTVRSKMRPVTSESDGQAEMNAASAEASSRVSEQEIMRRMLALPDASLPNATVKEAYARFIHVTDVMLRWLKTVLQMVTGEDDVPKSGTYHVPVESALSSARPVADGTAANAVPANTTSMEPTLPETVVEAARTRTVRVRRFEIHDAHYVYDNFIDKTKCFFFPEYTQYDARVQRRLLMPAYFDAVRDLLAELTEEISRLSDIAARKTVELQLPALGLSPYDALVTRIPSAPATTTRGADLPVIVFRPPLSSFRFLRDSLVIYLSSCINEDDTSSLLYYEHVYNDCLTQAREAAQLIRQLPTPPKVKKTTTATSTTNSAASGEQQAQSPTPAPYPAQAPSPFNGSGFEMLQVDHAQVQDQLATQGRRLSGWPPTREEQGVLASGFEAYWAVRGQLYELRASLTKDIRQKDRTHVTRVTTLAVKNEKSLVERMVEAQQRQFLEHSGSGSSRSLWGALRSSLEALGNAVTCKAEMNPGASSDYSGGAAAGNLDEEGVALGTTSPLHQDKQLLLGQVNQLWHVMEAQGKQLEITYPGTFFRGEKEKWADRLGRLAKKAEGASVVFGA